MSNKYTKSKRELNRLIKNFSKEQEKLCSENNFLPLATITMSSNIEEGGIIFNNEIVDEGTEMIAILRAIADSLERGADYEFHEN